MIHWLFFSTLATGLFYGLYCLLLRRDRWLQLNRWYLVVALAFSLVYPLLRLPDSYLPNYATMEWVSPAAVDIYADAVPDAVPQALEPSGWSAYRVCTIIYLGGVAATVVVLFLQLGTMLLRFRRMHGERRKGVWLSLPCDDTAPYSFFNHIVIGSHGYSEEEMQCMLAHEMGHVRRRHSFDVLLMRLMCCATWFNPFSWLMLRELKVVQECQADNDVLSAFTVQDYCRLLYRQTTGFGYGHITNKFNSINLKKRLKMMKQKKSRFGAWKLLAALPVAALLMALGNTTAEANVTDALSGHTLLSVTYNRTGGKPLPFGGVGYSKVYSHAIRNQQELTTIKVECTGRGPIRSWGAWSFSQFETSEGVIDGRTISRNERKLIKAVDKELRQGHASGTLSQSAEVKICKGKTTKLLFTATWENGNANGDVDITMKVSELSNALVVQQPDGEPEFIGGTDALYRYISENIHYPEQAKKDGIEGMVYVRFVVEVDGSVTEAEVVRGIGGGCDEEALRVINAMPKWKPGTQDGKPVRTQYVVPVNYKLK
ncbi:MAG: M56 family metallopeptidase [Bacteroidales bacterium]|nr:M56 family metallopeptidase [Bacteroidales bacterium]